MLPFSDLYARLCSEYPNIPKERAFHRWLPYALVSNRRYYCLRDYEKLRFLAGVMERTPNLKVAQQLLMHELNHNDYPEDIDYGYE